MSPDQSREPTRIYITGVCDGLDELTSSLAEHPEIELVGRQEHVANAAAALAGGHLGVVLHGTRHPSLPADELAAIREHTRTPVVLLASGEASALLEEALEADVADVLLLPQLTENVVFAARKARARGPPGHRRPPRPARPDRHRVLAEGRHRQDRHRHQPRHRAREARRASARCCSTSTSSSATRRSCSAIEPDRTIQDLMAAPGELDGEKLAGYTLHHTSGVDVLPAPVRPEDAELVTEAEAGPPARGRARVVRRDRRRHVAVLPRADAGHARPHRRAATRLRPGGADDQERAAEPADAGAALVPAEPDPHRAQPGELERRAEALRGRGGARRRRSASRCRATAPCRCR